MQDLKLFAELYWGVQRPKLIFSLNEQPYNPKLSILNRHGCCERVIYEFGTVPLGDHNRLAVEMLDKTDELNTGDTDHWVSLKDISVDHVLADFSFHQHTTFRHTMPHQWVKDMSARGINIQDQYTPGSDMRLNGICTIDFATPLYLQRTLDLWYH